MADSGAQRVRKPAVLSENDPLYELTRIMGIEPRRQEPKFEDFDLEMDLEGELMGDLAASPDLRTPALQPANSVGPSAAAPQRVEVAPAREMSPEVPAEAVSLPEAPMQPASAIMAETRAEPLPDLDLYDLESELAVDLGFVEEESGAAAREVVAVSEPVAVAVTAPAVKIHDEEPAADLPQEFESDLVAEFAADLSVADAEPADDAPVVAQPAALDAEAIVVAPPAIEPGIRETAKIIDLSAVTRPSADRPKPAEEPSAADTVAAKAWQWRFIEPKQPVEVKQTQDIDMAFADSDLWRSTPENSDAVAPFSIEKGGRQPASVASASIEPVSPFAVNPVSASPLASAVALEQLPKGRVDFSALYGRSPVTPTEVPAVDEVEKPSDLRLDDIVFPEMDRAPPASTADDVAAVSDDTWQDEADARSSDLADDHAGIDLGEIDFSAEDERVQAEPTPVAEVEIPADVEVFEERRTADEADALLAELADMRFSDELDSPDIVTGEHRGPAEDIVIDLGDISVDLPEEPVAPAQHAAARGTVTDADLASVVAPQAAIARPALLDETDALVADLARITADMPLRKGKPEAEPAFANQAEIDRLLADAAPAAAARGQGADDEFLDEDDLSDWLFSKPSIAAPAAQAHTPEAPARWTGAAEPASRPETRAPEKWDAQSRSGDTGSMSATVLRKAPVSDYAARPQPAYRGADYGAAPEIETVDVPEGSIAVADDLEIPDVAYQMDEPVGPEFDELEAEFAAAFNELSVSADDLRAAAAPARSTPSAVGEAPWIAPAAAAGAAYMGATLGSRRNPGPDALYAQAKARPASIEDDFDDEIERAVAAELGNDRGRPSFDFDDDEFHRSVSMTAPEAAPRRPKSRIGLFIAGLIGSVAILGVGGYMAWSGMSDGTGETSIVRADDAPMKIKPENPGGVVVPNQESKVYEQVAGGAAVTKPEQQALVGTAEEPVSLLPDQMPADDEPVDDAVSATSPLDGSAEAAPAPMKGEDRVSPQAAEPVVAAAADPAVSPRRVRTMIVRPDGSLVPREEPAAVETTAPETTAAVPADKAEALAEVTAPAPVKPVAKAQQAMPQKVAAAPSRPADQPVDIVGQTRPTQVAAAEAAPAAQTAAAGGWSLQIASVPSEAAAQSSYQDLARRYGSVIGGREAKIVKADIPGKGTYYRVRVAAGSREDANALCGKLKAAGGSCFVTR